MPICQNCGAELEGKFCSSCGTPYNDASNTQATPVQAPPPPVTQPVQMPQPRPQQFNPPPAPVYNNVSVIQQNKITSTGGWIGWFFLLTLLPIIGHIIMLLCSSDQSAKNFVKAQFIIMLIGIIITIAFFVLVGIGAANM